MSALLDPAVGAEPGTARLRAHGLGIRVDERWLVRGVDLELSSGEVLAVLGPNGAGKSTLLSLLAGDLDPSEGEVALDELAVRRAAPRELARRRAVLPQQNRLSFPFTVRAVAEMGRNPWAGIDDDQDDAVVDEAIAEVDLQAFVRRVFPSLSGGEQARAALARVLAQRAGVLLLDEPTAALDLAHQEQVMAIARTLAEHGAAVLAVLHDLSLAAAWADRIALLSRGRLVAVGAPAEVLDAGLLEDVYGIPVDVFPRPVTGELIVAPRRAIRTARTVAKSEKGS
ncbi:MAG TPA: heme ABC transporter ATP-binding protein [Gryllotalpicola sp.]